MPLLKRFWLYPMNDVATDVDAPPALDGRDGAPGAGPAMTEVRKEKVRRGYPDLLGGLLLPLPPAEALALAETHARAQRGWSVRRRDEVAGLFTAVAVTRLLRFTDDITVRVRPAPGGARVDVRSRSRLGRDDLGANAARIRHFFRELRAALPR